MKVADEPSSRLQMQYLTVSELCGTVSVAGYPVFHEGGFDRAGRGDLNATTRWVLRKHSTTLAGQPMAELPLDVTWEDVRAAMRHNLIEYWPAYAGPTALAPLHDDTVVVWTVATLCRILSTVVDGVIIAKPAAVGIWSRRVPDRWRTLLQEVRLKQSHADTPSGYASPLDPARDVQGFVVWVCAAGSAALLLPSRVRVGGRDRGQSSSERMPEEHVAMTSDVIATPRDRVDAGNRPGTPRPGGRRPARRRPP